MPRPDKFSHVVIRTHDVERLKDWYTKAFDLTVHAHSPGKAAIAGYDEEHHRFAFTLGAPEPGPDGRQQTTLKHVAYGYASLPALLAQYEHMKQNGFMPVETVNHGPTVSIYYEDPDGNGIEFFTERFATLEESKAFLYSEAFQKNMFGYYIDAERLAEQVAAGVDEAEIMRYDQDLADQFLAKRNANAS